MLPSDVVVTSPALDHRFGSVVLLFGYVLPHGSDSLMALVHHSSEIVPSRSGLDGGASYGGGMAADAPTIVVASAHRRSVGTHCDALAVVVHSVVMSSPGGTARSTADASDAPELEHAAYNAAGSYRTDRSPPRTTSDEFAPSMRSRLAWLTVMMYVISGSTKKAPTMITTRARIRVEPWSLSPGGGVR